MWKRWSTGFGTSGSPETPSIASRAVCESYGDVERHLILTDLADHLEKYADDGVLYFGDSAVGDG